MTPEQFVLGIVRDCNAKALFCGENFTFGAKAAGNPELLRKLCAPLGWKWWCCPWPVLRKNRSLPPASARRWRAATSRRQTPCWGCPTRSAFEVHHGAGLGRTLGCPPSTSSTRRGSSCHVSASISPGPRSGDTWYPSATGLGTRPTVNDDLSKVTCETFIPGFSGRPVWHRPGGGVLRLPQPQQKFDTLDELRDCINHAARRARSISSKRKNTVRLNGVFCLQKKGNTAILNRRICP